MQIFFKLNADFFLIEQSNFFFIFSERNNLPVDVKVEVLWHLEAQDATR